MIKIYITSSQIRPVSLSILISVEEHGLAAQLDRHGQRRTIELDIGVTPGTTLGEVTAKVRRIANEMLPAGHNLIFTGEAASLTETSHLVLMIFLFAILIVFLVLAAQFESPGSALIVIITVPFGLAAAIFALYLSGQSINLYSQIGLVMLVGILTKNASLMIEFMDQLRDEGCSVFDAIIEGAEVRLRPITMTVLSTVLGSLPLILSAGPGAEARNAIGWVVFGGVGLSALFTLYIAPLAYSLIAPHLKPRAHTGRLLAEQLQQSGLADK